MPLDPKILFRDPIVGPYILTKFQIDITLLSPSKNAVTEIARALAKHNSIISILFLIYRIEVNIEFKNKIEFRTRLFLGPSMRLVGLLLLGGGRVC